MYIPEREDIIWLDFEPTKGGEIGKYRPALVLSDKQYNKKFKVLICCPISTSIRNNKIEVPITNLEQPSVVASNLVQTLSFTYRNAKFITKAEKGIYEEVLIRLLPLIASDNFLSNISA